MFGILKVFSFTQLLVLLLALNVTSVIATQDPHITKIKSKEVRQDKRRHTLYYGPKSSFGMSSDSDSPRFFQSQNRSLSMHLDAPLQPTSKYKRRCNQPVVLYTGTSLLNSRVCK